MGQTELELGELDPALLARGDDGFAPLDDKWPERLAEIVDGLTVLYCRRGRDREQAIEEAQVITLWLAENQGGRQLYLPRGDDLKEALIHRQIYLLHRGNNTADLAQRFGFTERHVQRIYAEQRRIQIKRRQGNLFNEEGDAK
jgi:Mor family transcriptional regulator